MATFLSISVMTADFLSEKSGITGSRFFFPPLLGFVSAVWCQSRPRSAAVDRPSRSDCQGTLGRPRPSLPFNPSTEDHCRNLGSGGVQTGNRQSVRAAIDRNPVSDGAEPPEISWWFRPKQLIPTSNSSSCFFSSDVSRGREQEDAGVSTWTPKPSACSQIQSFYRQRAGQTVHERISAGLRHSDRL